MIYDQRVIWDDDSSNKDMSATVNDFLTTGYEIAFVAADDYLYIASDFPSNNRYFMMDVYNDQASTVTPYIWWANDWVAAVDVYDGTSSGGASLGIDGIIEWNTNRLKGWDMEDDSESVTGVDLTGIYNKYWLRLNWSGDFKATTKIRYVGQLYSTDTDLFAFYPDLNNSSLMTAYASGKTGWVDQHLLAAEVIIRELQRRGVIINRNQILNYHLFKDASVYKAAEIIYGGLGRAFDENRMLAQKYYKEAMNKNFMHIDNNLSGNLETEEKTKQQRYASR